MKLVAMALIGVVAAIHLYIVVLEMLLWQKPLGRKVFGTTVEQAAGTATLAANQGLYNGFLAAGLIWALVSSDLLRPVGTFFLVCVAAAGAFGAATVSPRILLVQTVPAVLALGALWLAQP
jgi:putative membrane protein